MSKKSEVYAQILCRRSWEVGNHTFHHLNAWKNSNQDYYTDIELTEKLLHLPLFRPASMVKIKLSQIKTLKKDFELSCGMCWVRDYDKDLTAEDCLKRILRSARPGSIVVFHDSLPAENRLRLLLPRCWIIISHWATLFIHWQNLILYKKPV